MSYNVKGLNSPEKRSMMASELKRYGAQIVYLQETHLRHDKIIKSRMPGYLHAYHAGSPDSRSRGVAILIDKSLPWEGKEAKADPEGRWLWVKGKCYERSFTLVTYYAPNEGQVEFFETLLEELEGNIDGTLIIAGDLNFAIDPKLDTSRGSSSMSGSKLRRFRRELASWQLLDPWRVMYPTERDYTFFSQVHGGYSRLDYFFVKHSDFDLVQKTTVEVITLSDHAPVSLCIAWGGAQAKTSYWRLNDYLLQDKVVEAEIRRDLSFFFQENRSIDTSPMIIWETHKAFVRGILIKHGARKKRERSKKVLDLVRQIEVLELKHKRRREEKDHAQLQILREKLKELNLSSARSTLARTRRGWPGHYVNNIIGHIYLRFRGRMEQEQRVPKK